MSPHYYAVIDYECTCWENTGPRNQPVHPHEIIEFPVVFLNTKTLEIDYEFHAYVRPTEHPELSPFCRELTGIQQSWVDEADTLDVVLASFQSFVNSNNISNFTVVNDGPWDSDFLSNETKRKAMRFPPWASRQFIDIRKTFWYVFKLESRIGVSPMLEMLGLEFEGRPHSGIDDARNIARIVKEVHIKAAKHGKLRCNRTVHR